MRSSWRGRGFPTTSRESAAKGAASQVAPRHGTHSGEHAAHAGAEDLAFNELTKVLVLMSSGLLMEDAAAVSFDSRSHPQHRRQQQSTGYSSMDKKDTPDPDLVETDAAWSKAFAQLARERDFRVLPYAEGIDRIQRSSLAELSNALLVGFAFSIYVILTLPDVSLQTKNLLKLIEDFVTGLFLIDYLARWWSRGLRPDYLLTSAMLFDAVSMVPFVFGPLVPQLRGVDLIFFKLLRVLRIYRYFRPLAFENIVRILNPPEVAEKIIESMRGMRPLQLQLVRTGGVVVTLLFVTAGLAYEAEHRVNPAFASFFESLYFAMTAISTVGFGDISPITPAGRAAVMVSVLVGLCVVPYQASLVASAVAEDQAAKADRRGTDADALLAELERSQAQLAWDAERIAVLEELEKTERKRIVELEERERVRIVELESRDRREQQELARIAELELIERQERARIAELERLVGKSQSTEKLKGAEPPLF